MTRISRHFNYTKRAKIPKSKVHIEVVPTGDGHLRGNIKKLDLSDSGQHAEAVWKAATVVVEARRTSIGAYHRHELGSVGDLEQSPTIPTINLDDFPNDGEVTFRLKVIDGAKKLLGEADGIRSGQRPPTDRDPLIELISCDLGEELWKVELVDAAGPRVLVNNRLPNSSSLLTRNPLLRGLIIPQIVRQVLEVAVSRDQSDDWVVNWMAFAARHGGTEPPNTGEDGAVEDWVDSVVESFTDSLKFATQAREQMRAGDEA
jgi:hypothetical protein